MTSYCPSPQQLGGGGCAVHEARLKCLIAAAGTCHGRSITLARHPRCCSCGRRPEGQSVHELQQLVRRDREVAVDENRRDVGGGDFEVLGGKAGQQVTQEGSHGGEGQRPECRGGNRLEIYRSGMVVLASMAALYCTAASPQS